MFSNQLIKQPRKLIKIIIMYKSFKNARINAIYHPIRESKFKDQTEIDRGISGASDWVENYQIYDKIADVVPLHLKTDREPAIIAECIRTNREFHDPEFPHSKEPLIDPTGKFKHKGWETLSWMSARDMFGDKPFYIFNGISPQDVKQQAIADCYLLGALACLATQPGLVRRLFDIEEPNKWGVYALWLNINGEWKEYVIDDYFPVNRNRAPVFARPTQRQREIWVMLVEKAYAKAYGGYYKIGLGRAGEAFRDLTGAPSITYELEEARKDVKMREVIWNKVVSAFRNSYLLAASSLHTGAGYEQKQENGIMTDHVYSILDVQEVMDSRGKAARILQMRNPWGAVEWKGDWADNSPLWTNEAREKLLAYKEDSEDGLFWMDYFDFCENFSLLFINKVEPTFTYNSVRVQLEQSRSRRQFFRKIIKVRVRKPGKYTFSIDKKDIHYTNEVGEILGLSTLTVARLEAEGRAHFVKAESNPYRNTHIRAYMEPGDYVAIIEVFYPDNVVAQFDQQPTEKLIHWRDVVFSTYGPSTCCLHLFPKGECDSLPLDPAAYMQYRAWRSFFRNPPEKSYKYFKKGKRGTSEGTADVQLENGSVTRIEYEKTTILGLFFYIFRNNTNKNLEFELKINTLDGYELICRDGIIHKSTQPRGRISIPSGSLDILVMRPIAEQARHGSVFINGRSYPERNRESKREAATHDYLWFKKVILDKAEVEIQPELKQSQPKMVKELVRGVKNNAKKRDPTDITMRKKYNNMRQKEEVMEMGNSQVAEFVQTRGRYANSKGAKPIVIKANRPKYSRNVDRRKSPVVVRGFDRESKQSPVRSGKRYRNKQVSNAFSGSKSIKKAITERKSRRSTIWSRGDRANNLEEQSRNVKTSPRVELRSSPKNTFYSREAKGGQPFVKTVSKKRTANAPYKILNSRTQRKGETERYRQPKTSRTFSKIVRERVSASPQPRHYNKSASRSPKASANRLTASPNHQNDESFYQVYRDNNSRYQRNQRYSRHSRGNETSFFDLKSGDEGVRDRSGNIRRGFRDIREKRRDSKRRRGDRYEDSIYKTFY